MFGMALFGLGRMGNIHIMNLMENPNVNLLYLVELDTDLGERTKNKLNLKKTKVVSTKEANRVFEDCEVHGVVICTPTDSHEDIVMEALKAGKGVLCEKPLAISLDGTRRCYEEAKARNLPLLCAFNRRFDPQINKVRSNIGLVGKIHSIKTCSRDSPRPPDSYLRISGGIFHDCAVHDIDLIRWCVGEDPKTVFVMAHCNDPEIAKLDDVDTVFIVMKFPSGVIAHIDLARDCRYGYHQTLEIFGELGAIESANPRQSAMMFTDCKGAQAETLHYSFKQRYAEAYTEEIKHFVELLKNDGATCRVLAEDTLQATRIAQACEDSWKIGQIVSL